MYISLNNTKQLFIYNIIYFSKEKGRPDIRCISFSRSVEVLAGRQISATTRIKWVLPKKVGKSLIALAKYMERIDDATMQLLYLNKIITFSHCTLTV